MALRDLQVWLAALAILAAAGCAPVPEVAVAGAGGGAGQVYPRLVPIEEVLDRAAGQRATDPGADAEIRARAARLRRRAAGLAGPVMSDTERRRLEASLAR